MKLSPSVEEFLEKKKKKKKKNQNVILFLC